MEQSIKNWLGGPNKTTFDNHRIINLMLLDNSKYNAIKNKYTNFNLNDFEITNDKFNYLLSIKDLHERYYVGMLFYGFKAEIELQNILKYINLKQKIYPKLYRGECRNKFKISDTIEFKNIISTTSDKEYARKFLNSDIKSGQSGSIKIMFVFKNVNAAYLKLNEDTKTTYRIWANSKDPNDKNFMNYDKCIKENIGDEYLISHGKFIVEKYKYFDNNNVVVHVVNVV